MKINLLHDCFVFDEALHCLLDTLRTFGHTVQHITAFRDDDSDITFSTGFLNIANSLDEEKVKAYKGKLIHWYTELLPVGSGEEQIGHLRSDQFKAIAKLFDYIFIHDPRQAKWMKEKLGISPAGVITCCPNPFLLRRADTQKKYDVLFYGNPSLRRDLIRTRLEELARKKTLNVMCMLDGSNGPLLKGRDKINMINAAKIVLNVHSNDTDSMEDFRVCECLGSGAFLLTEKFGWYPEDKLRDGRDFVSCSFDEIPDKILYYLEHSAERKRIADSGHRNIWKNFNWDQEWKKVEALIQPESSPSQPIAEDQFLKGRNYFFIVGPQRSGTTLTELILDSHPKIAVFGEPGTYEKLDNHNPEPRDHILGFKIPMWTHRWKYFQKEFPRAKILFMARDVKAITASMLTIPRWIETQISTEMENCLPAISDKTLAAKLRQDYEKFKTTDDRTLLAAVCAHTKLSLSQEYLRSSLDTHVVIYEDLVTKPKETVTGILGFLGLEWDPHVLDHPSVHHGVYMGGTDSQRPIDKDSINKWREILTKEETQAVEKYLGMGSQDEACPVCGSYDHAPYEKSPKYSICQGCGLHRQLILPEKTYEGPEENFGQGPGTGHLMSDEDKEANKTLAEALYSQFKPQSVLDIGCKYPYFLFQFTLPSGNAGKPEYLLGIDAIDEVIGYGQELGVPIIKTDVEGEGNLELGLVLNERPQNWDLITLVHTLEHFHDPTRTIPEILNRLSDGGVLFIRTPNPEIGGIERDLTGHHLLIHPYLFTRKSLQTLVESHGYEVFRQDDYQGYGQSDFYVRRKKGRRSTISVCMIVKNEEKNIEDCLKSVKRIADEIVIVDTGSTDNTKGIVAQYTDKIYDFEWCDDFSAARNFSISKATKDFILWIDADDLLENPPMIIKELKEDRDAYNFNIIYGNNTFCHVRLFRNYRGVKFRGMVHEVPDLGSLSLKEKTNLNIIHKTVKHSTEDRTERNYRILKKDVAAHPNSSRARFYLANTLREMGRLDEALMEYRTYFKIASWKDEIWMAHKYVAQIHMKKKNYRQAIKTLLTMIEIGDWWAESYYYLGECYFHLGNLQKCINWMSMAAATPMPDSTLFKETRVYQDLPYRYLATCYETLKDYPKALKYTKKALEEFPGDQWLKKRVEHFTKLVKVIAKKPISTEDLIIECYRQGAWGDCIMTTAALRGLKEAYPGCWIRYVTHEKSIPILEGNKYIDQLVTQSAHSDVDFKFYFCYPDKDSVLKDEGYPDKPLTRHLVQIFNECAGIPAGMQTEITLSEKELAFGEELQRQYGKYVTLHIQAGWSQYKEWYDDRWSAVVEALFKDGISTVQLGDSNDRILPNTVDMRGHTPKEAVATIKYAKAHMGVDSFTNHAAHAVGTRAVILFGSTSPTGSGYDQNINLWKSCNCSPCYREYEWSKDSKEKCPHNHSCMRNITADEVTEAIRKFL